MVNKLQQKEIRERAAFLVEQKSRHNFTTVRQYSQYVRERVDAKDQLQQKDVPALLNYIEDLERALSILSDVVEERIQVGGYPAQNWALDKAEKERESRAQFCTKS